MSDTVPEASAEPDAVPPAEKKQDKGSALWREIKGLFWVLLAVLAFHSFIAKPFYIPSESMMPGLLTGDRLVVTKYPYGWSWVSPSFHIFPPVKGRLLGRLPERGDIVIVTPPGTRTDYIKRVIGLPGDRIQVVQGILQVNGQAVKRERIEDYETPDNWGRATRVPQYRETLPNGVAHAIIEREGDRGFWDNTEVYTVPPGNFFMMGDNRDNSADSRDLASVGYVPFENFVGRAEIIFFSIDEGSAAWAVWEWPWTVRWERMFKPIR